ncbi:MAG TPA: insulinase family protein [Planctomycetota bacterium]|nr:insulinase family protein [Planctomycetota bacterium]
MIPAALIALSFAVAVQEPESKPTARLLGIEEHRLPNGLRVVLVPDRVKPTITVNLTVLVGSIHEGAGEAGMAHVFEHVLFRSLEGFPDVKDTFQKLGASFNGTTSFERTNFFETVPAGDENLETLIRLEAARLGRAQLKAEDLEKEGKIVESEFDIGRSFPQNQLVLQALGVLYDFHGYGRAPIGTVEDFKSLRVDAIRRFYERYYRPDNAVLFLGGRFEPARALALVRKHFGDLKAGGDGPPAYTTREPGTLGERRLVVRKPGDLALVLVAYRIPGAAHADGATADVLCRMLVAENAGPLHEALVARGLATDVTLDAMSLRMASPFFALATVPKDKDADAVEAVLLDHLEQKVAALAAADLDRAKSLLERDYDRLFNEPSAVVAQLSEFEAAGSWKLLLVRREQTKAVTLDAVRAFAAAYLRRENRVVGRFIPDDAARPVQPEAAPGIERYAEVLAKVPPTAASVKEFSYTPENLQAALSWTKVEGAEIGLIEKEVKGDDVHLKLWVPFAGRAAVAKVLPAGEALAALMTERTAGLDKKALSAKLSALKSTVGVDLDLEGATLSIRAKREHLAEVMGLAREMLRTPHLDPEALKEYVTRVQGELKSAKDNPMLLMRVIQNESSRMIFPEGDPRRPETFERQIEALGRLTVDDLRAFHRDFFGARSAIGGAVGRISTRELEGLLSPLLQGWTAAQAPVIAPDRGVDALAEPQATVRTPGKPNAFSVLIQPLRLSLTSPDAALLQAAAWSLFEAPLASRVARRLREDAALSYAAGGQFAAEVHGDQGLIVLFAATKPENAEKAVALIREEVARTLKDGLADEDLKGFKTSYASRTATMRSNDGLLSGAIVEFRRAGLDFTFWSRRDAEVAALTIDAVNAAARKHVDLDKAGLLRIGDFK